MDILYAVTDHFDILTLKVKSVEDVDDEHIITTEIIGVNKRLKAHHRFYFGTLWFDDNGQPKKDNVFFNKCDATKYASTKLKDIIIKKQVELEELTAKYETFIGGEI